MAVGWVVASVVNDPGLWCHRLLRRADGPVGWLSCGLGLRPLGRPHPPRGINAKHENKQGITCPKVATTTVAILAQVIISLFASKPHTHPPLGFSLSGETPPSAALSVCIFIYPHSNFLLNYLLCIIMYGRVAPGKPHWFARWFGRRWVAPGEPRVH